MATLIPSSEDVRVYEFSIMYPPNLDSKGEQSLLKEIDEIFAEAKAKLLFKDPWSRRGLAYKIKGFNEAKFVIYYLEMDPANIREVDAALRLVKGLMRHLIVMPPKGYEAISYEEKYQSWLKNRETVAESRVRQKEEKATQKVVDKAKRESKRIASKPKESKAPVEKVKLDASIDKMLADSDLKL
jgi:ribosomal protein S6